MDLPLPLIQQLFVLSQLLQFVLLLLSAGPDLSILSLCLVQLMTELLVVFDKLLFLFLNFSLLS